MTSPGTDPGPVTAIGPECFASADASVICWQGINYYREPDDDELARVFVVMDGVASEVPAACLNCSGEGWYIPGDADDSVICQECNGTGRRCTCGHPGLTYDGPDEDCPQHGIPVPVCTTCGQPMDDPQWCSRNPTTGKGGHTHGGGVSGRQR